MLKNSILWEYMDKLCIASEVAQKNYACTDYSFMRQTENEFMEIWSKKKKKKVANKSSVDNKWLHNREHFHV